jgi:ATP-dependent Clp protease adapter protein ClpS
MAALRTWQCLALVVSCLAVATAFQGPALPLRDAASAARCSISMQLASPQIAKPKVNIGNPVSQPQTAAGKPKTATPDLKPKQKTQDDETPMYKVILLGDNDYEQSHVVTSITKTIPSVKKEEAIRCFVEAQMTGSSLIITVTEEHAEHYVQQLKRQQVYAKMEKEKKG